MAINFSKSSPSREFIPLASPDIRTEDIDSAVRVLRSGMLVQGSEVARLEAAIAQFVGVQQAVCVANGTASLHLSLLSLGIGAGDEVIVPAFSFMATANVVELVGAKPVFVDVRADTFNIDVTQIEPAMTPACKAIMPVHEFGLCCDLPAIHRLAQLHDLAIIEDAACALGAKDGTMLAGSLGTLGSFSLHPRKAITCGEGGLVTTNNSELAQRIRVLRNHGIDSTQPGLNFIAPGFNYRMTDFQAALALSQFQRLPQTLDYRLRLASIYLSEIHNPLVTLPTCDDHKLHTWQSFHVMLDESLDRDAVIQFMRQRGIGCNLGAQCMPAQPWFQQRYQHDCPRQFPNAWRAFTHGLVLPLYEKMTEQDVRYVCDVVNQIAA
ncbi:MAG: DegT/DnrJ/EryC1/StrS family aminotransferase [Pirellulaceae bacterium]|nr:DegT/DnrJ/EryC1/StrS family aminotransferase [Pirellulaceae bacterium]